MASEARKPPVGGHPHLTTAVPVDLDVALDRLSDLGERFAVLVDAIEAPDARARGLDWTVAETAVHVWKGLDYYAACIRGEAPLTAPPLPGETMPAFVARENQAHIDAEPERDPGKIDAFVRAGVQDLVDAARAAGPDARTVFSAGYSEDTTTSVCTFLSELVVHGHDIAATTGARWVVDPESAVLGVYAATAGLPLALDPDAAAGVDIHLRINIRHGTPFSIRFRDGRVWTEVTDERPDVYVSADPVAYLMVGFGRVSLWKPLVRARVIAWGRRPWVALKVPKLLLSP